MDFGDEAYKRTLQKKINEKLKSKPVIESVDDLVDWKMDLWAYQYSIDYRMQELCDNYLSNDEIENFVDTVICNPYIQELPFFNQALMLLTNGDILYGGARGGGKAVSLDTLIPTPDGFTTMEDLMIGDTVFDENGEPCKVTGKSDVFFDHQCYKLVFDDGATVIADENHRWKVDGEHIESAVVSTQFIYETFAIDKYSIRLYDGRDDLFIVECVPVESVPCQCICVDSPNHMFLCTENFIPTHNSSAVLMGALQYVDFSDWSVGIFRLTYKDLTSAGAILNRAESWLYENPILKKAGIAPQYSKTKYTFTFPSGAEIQFAQIQYDDDAKHYQGAEFNEIYLDEAPQFSKIKLNRIRASVRKSIESPLPTGMKYTGNPGEISTEYFRDKFVQGDGYFIDSKFIDNYYLDFEEYESRVFEDLKYEDPVLYAQWRNGDWNASNSGSMFRTDWFKFYTTINERITRRVRFWDLASTEKVDPTKGDDPDWTVGSLLFRGESGRLYLDNVVRFRGEPDEVEETISEVAMQDGKDVNIFVEQEGGASGKAYVNYLQRVLQGYAFEGISSRKDKVSRAKPVASSIKYGNLRLRDGEDWIPDLIAEFTAFATKGIHDDQVDSVSGAFAQITGLDDSKPFVGGNVNDKINYLNSLI